MEHRGYLTEVYRRYPDPERTLGEAYRKAIKGLTVLIEENPDDARMKTVEALNVQLQQRLESLEAEYRDFRTRMAQELEELKKMVKERMA
jgi:molecular chaperone GrpE (heat shock protein)